MDWKTDIFRNESLQELRTQYKKLLSVGVSDTQAEELVVSAFITKAIGNDEIEGKLWVALAITEWSLGRLSQFVEEQAERWIEKIPFLFDKTVADDILITLHSPMMPRVSVPRERTTKCPWRRGDLLAYKITTCKKMSDNALWGKYVLLRVVDIKRTPVTYLAPNMQYDELMVVALYNWIGDTIPDGNLSDSLKIIPISTYKPLLPQVCSNRFSNMQISSALTAQLRDNLTTETVNYFYGLDCGTKHQRNLVFKWLRNDVTSATKVASLADTTDIRSLTGLAAFDIILIKRFETAEDVL